MKTFSKQIWHWKLLAPWWLGSGKSISWDRSYRSKEEHTLNSMKNKWVLRGRDESSYLWLQTLGYTPKFEVALVNACQAQRKIKHSITKCMGAYAILFKVLPCHSDRWCSILPKLQSRLKMIPGPPHTTGCTKILSTYDALVHIITKWTALLFLIKVFLLVPRWWLNYTNSP